MIAFGLLHATALLVIAFFIWFAASRSDGLLRTLGRILSVWLILLAVASIIFGIVAPKHHMHGWMAAPGENTAETSNEAANTTP
jgi:hypothetical protein